MTNCNNKKITDLFKHKKCYYENEMKKKFPNSNIITDKKQGVIIYPAGRKTETLVESFIKNGIEVVAIGDSNKNLFGKKIKQFEIFSPNDLANRYPSYPIIVTSTDYRKEIINFFQKKGCNNIFPISFLNFIDPKIFPVFPEYNQKFHSIFDPINQSDIIKLYSLLEDDMSRETLLKILKFHLSFNQNFLKGMDSSDDEYFDPELMSFSDDEVFIDCGAYIGDTIEKFNLITSGKYKKIYAFEPDRINFESLSRKCKEIDNTKIECYLTGVYNITGKINFMETGDAIARISDEDKYFPIDVISIDDFIKNKEVSTFMKMDIEGVEIKALLGAKNEIKKNKPKLAISIYHNATDLWKIPLLIKKLNNSYKIYLRHYSNEIMSTLCYAL